MQGMKRAQRRTAREATSRPLSILVTMRSMVSPGATPAAGPLILSRRVVEILFSVLLGAAKLLLGWAPSAWQQLLGGEDEATFLFGAQMLPGPAQSSG